MPGRTTLLPPVAARGEPTHFAGTAHLVDRDGAGAMVLLKKIELDPATHEA
jgi:hypothetical protein